MGEARGEKGYAPLSGTLNALFRGYEGPAFSIRLWDGRTWNSHGAAPPVCTIVLSTAGALRSLVLEGSQVALGEAFLSKDLEVEGDIFSVFEVAEHILAQPLALRQRIFGGIARTALAAARTLRHGPRGSLGRDRSSIAYHYDQPIAFFRPWLGRTMVYSCAYFSSAADSLDDAQEAKLEVICRKLRLEPDERFLDIGCGWGSLILHAVARHRAHAVGITLSRMQYEAVEERIALSGLGACCKVQLEDYRKFGGGGQVFDKIASVGMYEHVGLKNLPTYFGVAHRLLRPGGVFLNHGIARSAGSPSRGNDSFIARYAFPDTQLVTLNQAITAAESAGFEVRDVENLREHYELTLRRWVESLQHNRSALLALVPEKTYRIWLLYMAGCAAAFRGGDLGLYQLLLSRPDRGRSYLPLQREDWYLQSR